MTNSISCGFDHVWINRMYNKQTNKQTNKQIHTTPELNHYTSLTNSRHWTQMNTNQHSLSAPVQFMYTETGNTGEFW